MTKETIIEANDNMIKLRNLVLKRKPCYDELEKCYEDFLDNFEFVHSTIFFRLLEMILENKNIDSKTEKRVREIFKVIDLVRFPIKKAI